MAEKNMNAKISVEFEETANRQQLSSGDNLPTLFGKIKKFFIDLKPVALSGSYNDLDDKPESLPANGGNANTVNNLTVKTAVPENAVFTDTIYNDAEIRELISTGDTNTLTSAKEYAEGIINNPNLLINPDFSINQRGQTEYSGAGGKYGVDMWIPYPSHGIVTVNENGGINLSATEGVTSGYVRVNQGIETPLVEGEIYTLQVCFDGIVHKRTFVATIDFASHHFGDSNQYTVCTSCTGFILQLNLSGASAVHIKWVKLEPGKVATPFVSPNPAVELAKCQRCFVPSPLVGLSSSVNGNSLFFFIALPVEMRVAPSLQNAVLAVIHKKTNAPLDISEFSPFVYSRYKNGVLIGLSKQGHGLDVNDYVLTLTDGGLSAEL